MTGALHMFLSDPFLLMFTAVLAGLLIGRVGLGPFRFGVSGILFAGLVLGRIAYGAALARAEAGDAEARSVLIRGVVGKEFFLLFLIIFVAAVGLLASAYLKVVLRRYGIKFMALGVLITLLGALASGAAAFVMKGGTAYQAAGVYTGALTSSPGFAAALETAGEEAGRQALAYPDLGAREKAMLLARLDSSGRLTPEAVPVLEAEQVEALVRHAESQVGVGNAIAYPVGVLVVIFSMSVLPGFLKIDMEEEKRRLSRTLEADGDTGRERDRQEHPFDLPAFAGICLAGYLLGRVQWPTGPLEGLSLGSTGGVLLVALLLGQCGRLGPFNFRMDPKVLTVLRQGSLAMFLAVVGLRNGYAAFEALEASGFRLALSALWVSGVSVAGGVFVGRRIFKLNWILLSGALCGGMTSTPGLGAAIDAAGSDDPAAGYGAAYPFALMGMVVFTLMLARVSF